MTEFKPERGRAIERRAARALDQQRGRHAVQLAGVRFAESAEIAKLEATDTVATFAMACIAQQGVAEAWYASRAPHAAGRVSYVADEFAVAAAKRVRRLARDL